jgi:hypothetical protein
MTTGQFLDVKLRMLDPIDQILQIGEKFDWVDHLAGIIKSNFKEFQENGHAIKLSFLII